jgi:hypothetical protein
MRTCDEENCESIGTVQLGDKELCLQHAREAIHLGQPKTEKAPVKSRKISKADSE